MQLYTSLGVLYFIEIWLAVWYHYWFGFCGVEILKQNTYNSETTAPVFSKKNSNSKSDSTLSNFSVTMEKHSKLSWEQNSTQMVWVFCSNHAQIWVTVYFDSNDLNFAQIQKNGVIFSIYNGISLYIYMFTYQYFLSTFTPILWSFAFF